MSKSTNSLRLIRFLFHDRLDHCIDELPRALFHAFGTGQSRRHVMIRSRTRRHLALTYGFRVYRSVWTDSVPDDNRISPGPHERLYRVPGILPHDLSRCSPVGNWPAILHDD